ncbi:MAG TPA: LytR C-terminal domain-containing protein [Gaiellaceae bacterium]|nr:LytR C-terminal domain-containing protein [Gaiellaceae bacterium]
MDHAQPVPTQFPWRTTTVVAVTVALAELVALIGIGFAKLAPHHRHTASAATLTATTVHRATPAPKPVAPRIPSVPLRPRSHVRVLVLNGNGVSGAAGAAAARLQADGYRVGGATNAQRHDYAVSMVMYVPGWAKEARRLARDAGVRMVTPVDGLRGAQLRGSELVLLLGR